MVMPGWYYHHFYGIAPFAIFSGRGGGVELRFVPLKPAAYVPLVLVWQEDDDAPPVQRFRELLVEWKNAGTLWNPRSWATQPYD
jgi:hypothetical protein